MRILLIDDHDLFREGLKYLLPVLDNKVQYSEARDLDSALALDPGIGFDLVLLDLYMPGVDGMQALNRCREHFESASLVVVSGEEDARIIREAIEHGAAGFIPKSSSRDVLVSALQVVLGGGTYLPSHALKPLGAVRLPQISASSMPDSAMTDSAMPDSSMPDSSMPDNGHTLSRRQFAVLMRAIQGKSNKTIAKELDISDHTVKAHLSMAYRSLGVQNRTEAVYAAAKLGFQPGQADRYSQNPSIEESQLQ
ncbi:MAG: response regulator transcription factor [Pseudohongiella sp.]|nr:response regulator transcription factor [Pseudohongiella sp.]